MKNIVLKNGTQITLKIADQENAEKVVDFYNFIGGESDFLSFGKNEFPMGIEAEKKHIESMSKENNSVMIIAFDKDEIAGIITINSSQKRKMKHVGMLGIGIKIKYQGEGLGNILMQESIEWAKTNGVTKKISLVTRHDNEIAYKLYEKLGFETEGIFKKDNIENGKAYDSIYMSLFL